MPNETIQIIFLVLLNAYVWGGGTPFLILKTPAYDWLL